MTSIPIYRPYVFLRCKKCGRKTGHVLGEVDYTPGNEEVEETYECQECGETKKIYELVIRTGFPFSSKITSPTEQRHK